jgi:DNA-binding SARP family transcriptional activator
MRFALLGPVEVWADNRPVPFRRPRQRALLAYLLLARGRMASLDAIEWALWGVTPPSTARSQIQADVSALRRAFQATPSGSLIVTRPGGYQLTIEDAALDLDEFDGWVANGGEAAAEGDWAAAAAALRAALAVWRGPALAGIEAVFAEAARSRLDEQRLAAVELLAEVELRRGRHQAIVAELSEQVTAYPLREHLRALLMLALYRGGQRTEALATARDLRRRLADQQGLDPGQTVAALERMILRDDPELDAMLTTTGTGNREVGAGSLSVPRHQVGRSSSRMAVRQGVRPRQVPPAIRDFTGRADARARLGGLLTGARRPGGVGALIAVSGMGGVGKTTLAVRVAHDVLDHFPDGCLFRDLRGAADPHSVLGTFLRALGVAGSAVAADPDERLGQYRSITAGHRLLVVLDDAADEAQVRPLIPGSSGCAVLVTSRRPLLGLDGATGLRLTPLDEPESLDLLSAVVGPERMAADPAAAARVAAACGGLPLAVRIAGARSIASEEPSLSRLSVLLSGEHRRLAELTVGDRSLRSCFRVGLERLTSGQSRLFRSIGLHPAAQFTPHEAAVLAGRPSADVISDLRQLVDAQFVDVRATGIVGGERFALHDLVRQYATDLAENDDPAAERESAVHRLLESYLDTAHAAGLLLTAGRYQNRMEVTWRVDEPLRFTDQADAINWYEASHDALLAAVWQAAAHGWHGDVWRLALALRIFFRVRHHTDDWVVTAEAGLAAARHLGDRDAELRLCENVCGAYLQAGRLATCVEAATRAVELAEACPDGTSVARARHLRGIAHDRLGDASAAERDLTAALADPAYAASPDAILAWQSMGAFYGGQGRYDQCQTALHTALRLALEFNDEQTLCVIHHNLAELFLLTSELSAAAHHAREEISIAVRTRFVLREARGNEILAECLAADDPAARQAWQRAIEIYDQIDPSRGEASRARLAQAVPP